MARKTRLHVESLDDRIVPSFSPAVNYAVGLNPQAVVTADFNDDGRLDLATADANANTVSVRLGNGTGTFGPALTSTTGIHPEHMAVGDFNNDGKLDLATANNTNSPYGYDGSNDITILMGNGDGTFQGQHVDTYGWDVLSLAAGDFNGDGYDDLVYSWMDESDSGYPTIIVRLSNNLGGWSNTWETALNLTVADLNGDGNLDVAGANGGGVRVFLGNGDGTLDDTPNDFPTGTNWGWNPSVAVGDFTGDGIPDLAAAGATNVAILPGTGDGTFGSYILANTNNTGQVAVAAADFNGDGELDVVTADGSSGIVTALLGLGNGMLSQAGDNTVGSSPVALAVGDFNGDGRPDAVTANASSNTVSVLLNDGVWPGQSLPRLQIGDATVTEGNTGTVSATFTVTLSAASNQPITVAYATADHNATAGSDYQAASGTLTFAPNEISKTVTVLVIGDRLPEPNEYFKVNLSGPTNAGIADGQGVGIIGDYEPRVSISDVTRAEGGKGQTTLFTFTVTLSVAYDEPVTMSFRTVNGTATTGNSDYVAKTGTLTFAPGETVKTITIEVKGDSKREGNETFYLDLFGLSGNALFTNNRGVGTIQNDD
jgi:hypothetical protein